MNSPSVKDTGQENYRVGLTICVLKIRCKVSDISDGGVAAASELDSQVLDSTGEYLGKYHGIVVSLFTSGREAYQKR
jgi:hypothetical protein